MALFGRITFFEALSDVRVNSNVSIKKDNDVHPQYLLFESDNYSVIVE